MFLYKKPKGRVRYKFIKLKLPNKHAGKWIACKFVGDVFVWDTVPRLSIINLADLIPELEGSVSRYFMGRRVRRLIKRRSLIHVK